MNNENVSEAAGLRLNVGVELCFTIGVEGHGRTPNNVMTVSTRFKFPEDLWSYMSRFTGEDKKKYEAALAAEPEVVAIMKLTGVIEASCYHTSDPFDLVIKKGSAFDWSEIQPEVERLLKERHLRYTLASEAAEDSALQESECGEGEEAIRFDDTTAEYDRKHIGKVN